MTRKQTTIEKENGIKTTTEEAVVVVGLLVYNVVVSCEERCK